MRGRLSTDLPFTCVTCEIEIAGPAMFHVGLPFCCAGCIAGGPCTCSYDTPPNHVRVRECLDVEVVVGRVRPGRSSGASLEVETEQLVRPGASVC